MGDYIRHLSRKTENLSEKVHIRRLKICNEFTLSDSSSNKNMFIYYTKLN